MYGFENEILVWEIYDGSAQIVKELCDTPAYKTYFYYLTNFFSKQFSTINSLLKKTVWNGFNNCFKQMSKGELEMYFEELEDLLGKEISCICFYLNNFIILLFYNFISDIQSNTATGCKVEIEKLVKTITGIKGNKYLKSKYKENNLVLQYLNSIPVNL